MVSEAKQRAVLMHLHVRPLIGLTVIANNGAPLYRSARTLSTWCRSKQARDSACFFAARHSSHFTVCEQFHQSAVIRLSAKL
jgi:hypothetical protein